MADPILFKVEDAAVSLLRANAAVSGLMVQNADGSESAITIAPAMTASALEDSRITCEATEASSGNDRARHGNFDVTLNIHVVTAVAEHSVPSDGADANEDGEADSPPLTIDFDTLRTVHGARVSAVADVFRTDTLPDDISSVATGFGCYGHQFNGERQRVEGGFFIYTLSYILRGVCETDIE